MVVKVVALVAACVSGSAMALQGTLNSELGKVIGLLEASWIVHLSGAVVIALLLYVMRLGTGNLGLARQARWYTFFGGPLNVIIIYLVVVSIPRVGVARATTAIIIGQVTTAAIIDHFGLLGVKPVAFTVTKAIGLVLLALGGRLLLGSLAN